MTQSNDIIEIEIVDAEPTSVEVVENSVTVIADLSEIPISEMIQGIPVDEKGMPNGVATLDELGLVTRSQLPDINIIELKTHVDQWIDTAISPTATKNDLSNLDSKKADLVTVNQQLNGKLNRSEYNQHFRGVFVSIDALTTQVLNPVAGDYAYVDSGLNSPSEIHAYDLDDAIWRKQGGGGLTVTSTDSIPEGTNNVYFTADRVASVVNTMLIPINAQLTEIDTLLNDVLGI